MTASNKKAQPKKTPDPAADSKPRRNGKWNFFPAWCKSCGNCVAFCPRQALKPDDFGRPVMAEPDRCTACGLCEKLCPDFAISVGEDQVPVPNGASAPAHNGLASTSPERVPPTLDQGEDK